jgi:hypothetical protein
MPCYIEVRVLEGEFEDIAAMRKAARELGLVVREDGESIWIGELNGKKVGKKYKIKTKNERQWKQLQQRHSVIKIEKEAARQNVPSKRVVQGNVIQVEVG